MEKKRRQFSSEFRSKAVRQVAEGGNPLAPEFSTRCCGEQRQGALLAARGKLLHRAMS